jgi:hypothetical protein
LDEPDLAFVTWEEGMRRWPDSAPTLYSALLSLVRDDPDLRDRWRKLGEADRRCLPVLFGAANSIEFAVELERILSDDPELRTLTRQEQSALFSAWYRVGDRLDLARMVREHPAWNDIAWREQARVSAGIADFQQAYRIAIQHTPAMVLPSPTSRPTMESLAARFRLGQLNEHDALVLAVTQDADGQTGDALETLKTLSIKPRASKLVYFVESQWRAKRNEWQQAWEALSKCIPEN